MHKISVKAFSGLLHDDKFCQHRLVGVCRVWVNGKSKDKGQRPKGTGRRMKGKCYRTGQRVKLKLCIQRFKRKREMMTDNGYRRYICISDQG
jgi:hypothetical protein